MINGDNEGLMVQENVRIPLPTKEQLKTEIERQKKIFYMQHPTLHENKE